MKYDKNAEDALDQIYEKHYIDKVKDHKEILLVGINYDKHTKHYECIIGTYDDTQKNKIQDKFTFVISFCISKS